MEGEKRAWAGAEILPLRAQRLRMGVSLEQIEAETKISRRFLEAIEAGEYEKLPGGVFTRSYIRQYAARTGYDAAEILADCARRSEGMGQKGEGRPMRGRWRSLSAGKVKGSLESADIGK